MGVLFYSAFGTPRCENCGPVPRSEFAADVQRRLLAGTLLRLLPAVALLFVALALLYGR